MQLTKSYFSIFAEDFGLMKSKLKAEEIVEMLSGMSDMCMFGETQYKPNTKPQEYFWDKILSKYNKDLACYNASVENGKKGGRPSKNKPERNPEETQSITQNKTQEKPRENPDNNPNPNPDGNPEQTQTETHLTPNTLHLTSLNTISSDKSSDMVVKINEILTKYGLPKIEKLTDERKSKLKERCKSVGGFENFLGHMENFLAESSFLRGENDKGWQADFDFLLTKSKWQKALEGGYKDKKPIREKQGFYDDVFENCVKNGSEFLERFND